MTDRTDEDKVLHCSFCGKSQNEVKKLIAGRGVYICDECIDVCINIVSQEVKRGAGKQKRLQFMNICRPRPKSRSFLTSMSLARSLPNGYCRLLSITIISA